MILPTLTICAFGTGLLVRLVRRSVAETFRQPFVTTARGKSLNDGAIAWRHVVRNSAIPVVTVLGLQLGTLIAGVGGGGDGIRLARGWGAPLHKQRSADESSTLDKQRTNSDSRVLASDVVDLLWQLVEKSLVLGGGEGTWERTLPLTGDAAAIRAGADFGRID